VLRHTWLCGFDSPEPLTAFEKIGAAVADYGREAGMWGSDVPGSLVAIADDFDSLGACLEEVMDAPAASCVSRELLPLCRWAEAWAEPVRRVGAETREALGVDSQNAA